ncbi:MAG: hypothetical protein EOM87_10255 [Clostridia bacterium]|nr:hypothetical protein [Clostridia bacterium]
MDKRFVALYRGFTKTPEGYEVKFIQNGREVTEKTRVIIGADGAFSRIRKSICNDKNTPETYIAIQEWFEAADNISYFTAIFDEEISDFYSWIIPKEKCLLLGSALTPKDNAGDKIDSLKAKLKRYGFNFDNKIKTEGAYIYRPKQTSQLFAGKDNIALVGEAAGAISPSSAEGISYALKSSLYLAQSLEEGLNGFLKRYNDKLEDIKLNILIKNLKCPAMYNHFLRYCIMKSGIQSITRI